MASLNVEFVDATTNARYTSSVATRARRKSKRSKKGGKAGNPGVFSAGRLAFFAEHQPEFNKLKKTARTPQNNFWAKLFKLYWVQFPWTVPLKDDDVSAWPLPDEKEFSPEERKAKGKVIDDVKKTVKRHMRYVRDRLQDMENPWTEVLAELVNREEPPPPPRQLAPWQLYMSKKKPEIDAELEERRAAEDTPRERVLALRSLIARELLAEETEEYRAALQTECEEIRDADVAMEQQEPVRTRPTEAAQTQDKLAAVVQPLLQLIREHTGMYVTLLAGAPLPGGNQLKIVSAGKSGGPSPMPWHLHDPGRFKKDVMGAFTAFLARTPEGLARASGQATMDGTPIPGTTTSLLFSANATPGASTADAAPAVNTSTVPITAPAAMGTSKRQRRASSPKRAAKRQKSSKGKSRSRRKARDASDEESEASSSESEEETETSESDEDEDEGASVGGQEEPVEGAGQGGEEEDGWVDEEDGEVPEHIAVPSADDLDLNDAVRRQLDMRSPRSRRMELYGLSQYEEFDRMTLGNRVRAAEIILSATTTSPFIPLCLNPLAALDKAKQGGKKKKNGKKTGGHEGTSGPAGPVRQSGRLAARGVGAASSSAAAAGGTPVEQLETPQLSPLTVLAGQLPATPPEPSAFASSTPPSPMQSAPTPAQSAPTPAQSASTPAQSASTPAQSASTPTPTPAQSA
ncbi:uncharacterized protein TRAVEDRAFT_52755, partial [Trametes versicolor FP-101664 SS1]|uniref:uncharacterized protein n=1 Tax=Trametes versicolor (strain FP-101664) TaxID=717944 RepID=UPI0004623723